MKDSPSKSQIQLAFGLLVALVSVGVVVLILVFGGASGHMSGVTHERHHLFTFVSVALIAGLLCYLVHSRFAVRKMGALQQLTPNSGLPDPRVEERLPCAVVEDLAVALQKKQGPTDDDNGQLRALSRRLLQMNEAERREIARELHDEVGQTLTGLKIALQLGSRGATPAAQEHLRQAQDLLSDLMGMVRSLSLDLRPPMLDDLGLLPTLLWHFERYTNQTTVRVRFEHAGLGGRFAPELETAIYRIIQEALTNVARHGRVEEVSARLSVERGRIALRVEDRGVGFVPAEAAHRETTGGLLGMRERALLVGGDLNVTSAPGQGTRIVADLPLDPGGTTPIALTVAPDLDTLRMGRRGRPTPRRQPSLPTGPTQ